MANWSIDYNGFGSSEGDWSCLTISSYRVDPIMDRDGQTQWTTQHTLTGTALLSVTTGQIDTAIIAARTALAQQARNLVVKVGSAEVVDAGSNTNDAGTDARNVDSAGFPTCSFTIQKVFGSASAQVAFTFVWQDFDVSVGSDSASYDVQSHWWAQTFNITENGRQTWTVNGAIRVRANAGAYEDSVKRGSNPDCYRSLVMPQVPPRFRIQSMNWGVDQMGEILNYQIVMQEHARRLPHPAKVGTGRFVFMREYADGFLGMKVFDAQLEGDADSDPRDLLKALLLCSEARIRYTPPAADMIQRVEYREEDIFSAKRIGIRITAKGMRDLAEPGDLGFDIFKDYYSEKHEGLAKPPGEYGAALIGAVKRELFRPAAGYVEADFPKAAYGTLDGSALGGADTDAICGSDVEEQEGEFPEDALVDPSEEPAPDTPSPGEEEQSEQDAEYHYINVVGTERMQVKPNIVGLVPLSSDPLGIPWQTAAPDVYIESEYRLSRHDVPPPRVMLDMPPNSIVIDEDFSVTQGDPDANMRRLFSAHYRRRVKVLVSGGVSGSGAFWPSSTVTLDEGLTIEVVTFGFSHLCAPFDPRTESHRDRGGDVNRDLVDGPVSGPRYYINMRFPIRT